MAKKRRNRRSPAVQDLLAAWSKGPDAHYEAVSALLESGGLNIGLIERAIRTAKAEDAEVLGACLRDTYAISGAMFFPASSPDGTQSEIRADTFAFCVDGEAETIAEAYENRGNALAAMFVDMGVFREDSAVHITRPYDLEDLARISPWDISVLTDSASRSMCGEGGRVFNPPGKSRLSGGSVLRIFLGVYIRDAPDAGNAQDFPFRKIGLRTSQPDSQSQLKKVAKVFGPGCSVSLPCPVEQAGDLVMDFVLDGLDTKRTRRTSREERAAEAGSCGVPKVISLLGERTIDKWVKDDSLPESGNVIAFPSRFHR